MSPRMKIYPAGGFRRRLSMVLMGVGVSICLNAQAAHARRPSRAPAAPVRAPQEPAADADGSCGAAYKSAQDRQQAGALREARELFQTCAQPTCGAFLQQECSTRFAQLNHDIPTVIPVVTDEKGAPRVDVEVKMDGKSFASELDGRALPVDPGMHEFVFSTDRGVISTQKILVAEGQRNRVISVSLRAKKGDTQKTDTQETAVAASEGATSGEATSEAPHQGAPEETTPEAAAKSGPSRTLTYTLGGVGLAGLGTFGLLTYWGRKDNDKLGQCAPNCPQGTVDHIHRLYLSADVALGVGIAAIAAAYLVYAHSRSTEEEAAGREEALLFGVQPSSSGSGAVGSIAGTF
jgi:hypothetical protein